jgi:predicted metalloendopeptidase
VAFAQLYCENRTPTSTAESLGTDPHSPSVARVNATLSKLPEFAQAFSCSPTSAMLNSARCEVW